MVMANIYYNRTDEFWRKEEKYDFLNQAQDWQGIEWRRLEPNDKYAWLTEGLQKNFEEFLPIGTKDSKSGDGDAIFENYGRGVATSRDAWAYNFDRTVLAENMSRMIDAYNEHVFRWASLNSKLRVNDFVDTDSQVINWSRDLKGRFEAWECCKIWTRKDTSVLVSPFFQKISFL